MKSYGTSSRNDFLQQAIPTADSGYLFCGYSDVNVNTTLNDFYLVKTDRFGDTLWSRTYGGANSEYAYAVCQTRDHGYFIGGLTSSYGDQTNSNIFLMKVDSTGKYLWSRTFGNVDAGEAWSVMEASDGSLVASCMIILNGYTETALIKMTSGGTLKWINYYNMSVTSDLRQAPDGNYYFCGETIGSVDRLGLCKVTPSGTLIFYKTYEKSLGGTPSVDLCKDNGFIMTGSTFVPGPGNFFAYLIKTNSLGDTLWTKTYSESKATYPAAVLQIGDGGYILLAYSTVSKRRCILIKTDSTGNTQWAKNYTYSSLSKETLFPGVTLSKTLDGGYLIGATGQTGSGYKGALLKVTANGTLGCMEDTVNMQEGRMSTFSVVDDFDTFGDLTAYPSSPGTVIPPMIESVFCQNNFSPPVASFTVSDTSICQSEGGNCVTLTNFSSNATSYAWTFQGVQPSSDTTSNPLPLCFPGSGNYKITLIASNKVSSDTGYQFVSVHDPLMFTISKSSDTLIAPPGYKNYQWFYNSAPLPGDTTFQLIPTKAGQYNVSLTDSNGCVAYSNTETSTVNITERFLTGLYISHVQGALKIHSDKFVALSVEIYTCTGCNVYKGLLEGTDKIISTDLPAGIYFLQLSTSTEKKVVKLVY